MFFAHEEIERIRPAEILENPRKYAKALKRLLPNTEDRSGDRAELLKSFIAGLPEARFLPKIANRLCLMAEHAGMKLSDLRWWDISSKGERIVVAVILRQGVEYAVSFHWKRSVKGSSKTPLSTGRARWARDLLVPFGWRCEFEADTYQQMKLVYHGWLVRKKLLPFPDVPIKPRKLPKKLLAGKRLPPRKGGRLHKILKKAAKQIKKSRARQAQKK